MEVVAARLGHRRTAPRLFLVEVRWQQLGVLRVSDGGRQPPRSWGAVVFAEVGRLADPVLWELKELQAKGLLEHATGVPRKGVPLLRRLLKQPGRPLSLAPMWPHEQAVAIWKECSSTTLFMSSGNGESEGMGPITLTRPLRHDPRRRRARCLSRSLSGSCSLLEWSWLALPPCWPPGWKADRTRDSLAFRVQHVTPKYRAEKP